MDLKYAYNTSRHANPLKWLCVTFTFVNNQTSLPSTNTTGTFGGSNLIWEMFCRGNCPSGGVLVNRNLPSSSLIQKSLSCISKSWDPLFSLSATETNISRWFLWFSLGWFCWVYKVRVLFWFGLTITVSTK